MKEVRILTDVKQAKRLLPVWLAPFVGYLLMIMGQLFAALFFSIFLPPLGQVFGWSISPSDISFLLRNNPFIMLSSFLFIALIIFAWVKWFEKRPLASLGLRKKGAGKAFFKGFGIGSAMFSVVVLLALVTGTGRLSLASLSPQIFLYILAIIPFWVIQSTTEELLARTWLFPVLKEKSNFLLAIILSSAFFVVIHLFNSGLSFLPLLNLFLFAVFAGLYLLATDTIWGIAGIHSAWNFVQGNIYGVQVSGQSADSAIFVYSNSSQLDWLTGGAFGLEGSIFTTALYGLFILYYYRKLKNQAII